MILINGKHQELVSVSDRGFQYGDGLFETIEIKNESPVFFQQHWQRLQQGCEKLLLPCPDIKTLTAEIYELSRDCQQGVLKIIITRGLGGRGYKLPEIVTPTRVLSLHPFPDYPVLFWQHGIKAIFCQQRLGLSPSLAGIKHLNRLEQVLARAEWNDSDIQEGLMLDINENVIEGTMTNLFFVKNNILYTPCLEQSGIAGIMRAFVLETAKKLGVSVVQGYFNKQQVLEADAIFVTNSIIGIWAVRELEHCSFDKGELTQQLQQALEQYKQQAI